jgi:type IV pilus assembly protein PilA
MKGQKGFSLIELLIVVAIILIIAAIAIPNLLRARMSASEAAAVGSIRTINTVEVQYNSTYGHYSPDLASLGSGGTAPCAATPEHACLIDDTLATATTPAKPKSGYYFTFTSGTGNASYSVVATPAVIGQTGQRGFYSDQSGVIRFTPSATTPPNSTSPALQ